MEEAIKSFGTLPDSDKRIFCRLLGSLGESKNVVSSDESFASSEKSDINVLLQYFKNVNVEDNVQSAKPEKKQKTLDSWLIKKDATSSNIKCPVQKSNTDTVACTSTVVLENDNLISDNSSHNSFTETQKNVKDAKSSNCKDGNVKDMQVKVDRLSTSPKTGEIGVIGDKSYNLRSNRKSKLTFADSDDNIKENHIDNNITCTKVINEIDKDEKVKNSGNECTLPSQDLPLLSSSVNRNKLDSCKMGYDSQTEQSVDSSIGSNSVNIPDINKPSYKRRIRKKSLKVLENESITSSKVSDQINHIESEKKIHKVKHPVVFDDNIPKNSKNYIDSETVQPSTRTKKITLRKLESESIALSGISNEVNASSFQVDHTKSERKLHPVKLSVTSDDTIIKNNKNCNNSEIVQSSVRTTKTQRQKEHNLKKLGNVNIASSSVSDEANASDQINRTEPGKKVHPLKTSVVSVDDISKDITNCTDSKTIQLSVSRTKRRSSNKLENENTVTPSAVSENNILKNNKNSNDSEIVQSSVRTKKKCLKKLGNENIASSSISDEANASDQISHTEPEKKVHTLKTCVVSVDNISKDNITCSDSEIVQSSVSRTKKRKFNKLENENTVTPSAVSDNNSLKNNKNGNDSEIVQSSVGAKKRCLKKLGNENNASPSISDEANVSDKISHTEPEKKVHPLKTSVLSIDNTSKDNTNCTDSETVQASAGKTKKKSLKKLVNENVVLSSISDKVNVSNNTELGKTVYPVNISVVSNDNTNYTDSKASQSPVSENNKKSLKGLENKSISATSVVSDNNLKNNKNCSLSEIVQSSDSITKKRSSKKLGNENITSSSISDETNISSDQIDHKKSGKKEQLVKPFVVSDDSILQNNKSNADFEAVQSLVIRSKKRNQKKFENENISSSSISSKANVSDQIKHTDSEIGVHLVKSTVTSDDNIPKNKICSDSETVKSSENTVHSVNPNKSSPCVSEVSPRKSKRIGSKKLLKETEINDVNLSSIFNQDAAIEQVNYTASEKNVRLATTTKSGDTTSDKYSDNSTAVTEIEKKITKEKYFEKTGNKINAASQLSQVLSVGFSVESAIQLHSSNIQDDSKTDQPASDTNIISCDDKNISNMSKRSSNPQMKKSKSKKSEIESNDAITSNSLDLDTVSDQTHHMDLEQQENINFLTNSTLEFNHDAFCNVKTALIEVGLDIYDILQNKSVKNVLSDYENNPCDDAVVFIGTHTSIDENILPVIHTHVSKTKLLERLCETQNILSKKA